MNRQQLAARGWNCAGHCPTGLPRGYCCQGCSKQRRRFARQGGYEIFTPGQRETVRSSWRNDVGFLRDDGCALARELRPTECLRYDCRVQVFLSVTLALNGNYWQQMVRETQRPVQLPVLADEMLSDIEYAAQLTGQGVAPKDVMWLVAKRKEKMRTMYLTIGFLGSGKSDWAKKFVAEHPETKIVCADAFRTMLNGTYRYEAELDDAITESMADTARHLLDAGYGVIIDCGNLTRERRSPWLEIPVARRIAVMLPQKDIEWHIANRLKNPHWDTDWQTVAAAERATYERPEEEFFDEIIHVEPF